jgi:hypothetical protein
MSKQVGTKPYQTPRNADLGTLAYQDHDAVGEIKLKSLTAGMTDRKDGDYNVTIARSAGGSGALKILGDSYYSGNAHIKLANIASSGATETYALISFDGADVNIFNSTGQLRVGTSGEQVFSLIPSRSPSIVAGNEIAIVDDAETSPYTYSVVKSASDRTLELIANAYPANLGIDVGVALKAGSSGGGGPNNLLVAQRAQKSNTVVHVNGGLSLGSYSTSGQGTYYPNDVARRVLNWYVTPRLYNGSGTHYYIKTNIWAGGSLYGNRDYIMGGFELTGYRYTAPANAKVMMQFHNWSGSYYGYSVSHSGDWQPDCSMVVSSDGYVTLKLGVDNGYVGYFIDLYQHTIYPTRDFRVVSVGYTAP